MRRSRNGAPLLSSSDRKTCAHETQLVTNVVQRARGCEEHPLEPQRSQLRRTCSLVKLTFEILDAGRGLMSYIRYSSFHSTRNYNNISR